MSTPVFKERARNLHSRAIIKSCPASGCRAGGRLALCCCRLFRRSAIVRTMESSKRDAFCAATILGRAGQRRAHVQLPAPTSSPRSAPTLARTRSMSSISMTKAREDENYANVRGSNCRSFRLMGGAVGPRLAAAVSDAGGLGNTLPVCLVNVARTRHPDHVECRLIFSPRLRLV